MSEPTQTPPSSDESDRLIAKCFWITTLSIAAYAISVYIFAS